jgi:carbon starvation protein CstA
LLTQLDFSIIWRYFAWSNQTLAAIVLWTVTVYLAKENKFYWVTFLPAIFMTVVTVSYICVAPEGLHIAITFGYIIGIAAALVIAMFFLIYVNKRILKAKK